jgi:hypothetical protein
MRQLHLETIVEVVEEAVTHGATGFTFSVHPNNLEILRALSQAGTLDADFEICPVLPYAAGYVRAVNEKGIVGFARDLLSRLPLSGKAKVLLKGSISAASLDPVRILSAYVDMELAGIQR